MLRKLSKEDRLHLMKFVCSFAWADLEVQDAERKFVDKMASKLGLTDDEKKLVKGWLRVPPPIEEVDPARVPAAHRQLFVDAARETIRADGMVTPDEDEMFQLFVQLVQPGKRSAKRG